MINFTLSNARILLHYTPERADNWLDDALKERPFVQLKKTFTVWKDLLVIQQPQDTDDPDDFGELETTSFLFAITNKEYYQVISGILTNDFDIYLHQDLQIETDFFLADSDVSIFRVIGKVYMGNIYIGGDHKDAIPIEAFNTLISRFPSGYERKKYVEARISSVLRDYLDKVRDAEKSYQKYVDKKLTKTGTDLLAQFHEYEAFKYKAILDKLKTMLGQELHYGEKQWQEEILQIMLLLYPKYIQVFKEVTVEFKDNGKSYKRFLDFLLVDSNGNIDIIEIKKPFENSIMTTGMYRNNFIPMKELSGTVMQIEKYIYYLNRWSDAGEKMLLTKYRDKLPVGFKINITNPNGIIIMGRDNNLSTKQKQDFEVVKRKYKNVVDIITYDNLIERLVNTIRQLQNEHGDRDLPF